LKINLSITDTRKKEEKKPGKKQKSWQKTSDQNFSSFSILNPDHFFHQKVIHHAILTQ